jgi:hypothetical protein
MEPGIILKIENLIQFVKQTIFFIDSFTSDAKRSYTKALAKAQALCTKAKHVKTTRCTKNLSTATCYHPKI